MVETITPAGCGSRQRYRVALALFTVGAVAAAAALGALLGLVGSPLDRDTALAVVGVLAVLAAAREAGLVRFPVPQMAHQVPERWRREWPLPAWSLGYGAGLGAGVFTHQMVATFWVAAAAVLALGDPAVSAACLATFGLGRALMVILPARGGRDPSQAVERLAARRRLLRPVNAVALAALAGAIAVSPALGQDVPTGTYDPSASGSVLATGVLDDPGGAPAVVVQPLTQPTVRFEGGRSPALDGDLLAYSDTAGVRVVQWRTGAEVARIAGPLTKPAIDWPYIAYIRALPVGQSLELFDASTGATRVVESSRSAGVDIGRPALRGGLIAWHVAAGRRSQIRIARVDRRGHRVVASSVTGLQVNPSMAEGRILWVEQSGRISYLRMRRISGGHKRTLATLRGPSRFLWTTALASRTAYATRWNPTTGKAELISRRWR